MIARFLRNFFWSLLVGVLLTWLYLSYVRAGAHEAILIEDRYTGLDPRVLLPGQTRMVWQMANPGRVHLHRVDIGPRVLSLNYRRPLAQSELLGLDEAFYVQADLRIDFSLDPQRSDALFRRLGRPDWSELDAYLRLRLSLLLDREMERINPNDAALNGLERQLYAYFNESALLQMNEELAAEGVHVDKLWPVRLYTPDPARYQAMLQNAPQILAQKLERIRVVDDARARQDASRITDEAYVSRMQRMGELMERFPQLRSYLAIDRLGNQVQVYVVPYEGWNGGAPLTPGDLVPPQGRRNQSAAPGAGPAAAPAPPAGAGGGRFQDLTPP
ncbi:MAG: hypothetical protein K1X75_09080 [Leptospirales bacterium]|nr:hypothetical protein [Leptospirales bacterium]